MKWYYTPFRDRLGITTYFTYNGGVYYWHGIIQIYVYKVQHDTSNMSVLNLSDPRLTREQIKVINFLNANVGIWFDPLWDGVVG